MDSSVKDRLVAAREAKAKREADAKAVAETRELTVLDLEARLEKELGPRGEQFEIVDTVEGPIAVKLGEAILYTRFSGSKVTESDVHDFVFPCLVHPDPAKYLELVGRRPHLAVRCASALAALFGAKSDADTSKF